MLETIERRSASCAWEIRETPDGVVGLSGYAAVFDSESYGEVVRRTAFNKTLADGADVRFLIDHAGLPLARTKSGTMRLRVDSVGLRMDIDALDMASPTVQSLVSAIKRGDLDQMSFAFMAVRDNYTADGVRELTEVKLVDVSAVTYPWYEATSIGMKSDGMELVEARDSGDALNSGEPMEQRADDMMANKVSAAKAALYAAKMMLALYDDPAIAQAYALLCAAYYALDDMDEAPESDDTEDVVEEPAALVPDDAQEYAPYRAASDRPNVRALALDELRRTISRA
jgi:HK97 family phage prohead protease